MIDVVLYVKALGDDRRHPWTRPEGRRKTGGFEPRQQQPLQLRAGGRSPSPPPQRGLRPEAGLPVAAMRGLPAPHTPTIHPQPVRDVDGRIADNQHRHRSAAATLQLLRTPRWLHGSPPGAIHI